MAECYAQILVVDDQPLVGQVCAEILAEEGYQVRAACGGREALARLENEPCDLLLADLKMPDVDGLTVLRRARELYPGLAAVMMTSYATMKNAIEAMRAGAQDFLLKPFDPNELLQAVNEALAARCREQAVAEQEATLQALRAREAQLQLMIQQVGAVVWTTDAELRFTSCQGASLAGLDLSPDHAVDLTLTEYLQTKDADFSPIAACRRALQGESVSYEHEWRGRAYRAHVEPLRDGAGRIVGTVGVALDVSGWPVSDRAAAGAADKPARTSADETFVG